MVLGKQILHSPFPCIPPAWLFLDEPCEGLSIPFLQGDEDAQHVGPQPWGAPAMAR